jgi:hypothetical protein
MKYSMICLDKALELILPTCSTWPKTISRPTLLGMAAKEVFMWPQKFTGAECDFAIALIRGALIELTTLGQMNFGDTDDFEL